jgi:rRNA maturation endonuclease Nob1
MNRRAYNLPCPGCGALVIGASDGDECGACGAVVRRE